MVLRTDAMANRSGFGDCLDGWANRDLDIGAFWVSGRRYRERVRAAVSVAALESLAASAALAGITATTDDRPDPGSPPRRPRGAPVAERVRAPVGEREAETPRGEDHRRR